MELGLGWVTPASGSSSVEGHGWLLCGSLWPCFSMFLVEASLKWEVVTAQSPCVRLWSKTVLSSPETSSSLSSGWARTLPSLASGGSARD